MLARHAAIVDPRKGQHLAERAARVAERARQLPVDQRISTNASTEWMSWRLAAACAKEQKQDRRAKELAEMALAAGAPREAVEAFV